MEIIHVNDELRVTMRYDEEVVTALRQLGQGRWNPEQKHWTFPVEKFNDLVEIKKQYAGRMMLNSKYYRPQTEALAYKRRAKSEQLPKNIPYFKAEYETQVEAYALNLSNRLVRMGYSPKTISGYTAHLRRFLYHMELKCDSETINTYLLFLLEIKCCSHAYVNQAVNTIKHHLKTEGIYHENDIIKIQRPKKERKLPKVLGKNEILLIFQATENLKHKTELMMGYSCGMRVGEVAHLMLKDIDFERQVIYVRQGKGRKDRMVPLSQTLATQLLKYVAHYHPFEYVFESQERTGPVAERTLQKVFQSSCEKVGILKEVSFHSLRHSFATHLLESGVDLRYIQELLGHANSKTTEIYTHVSNKSLMSIVNPLDSLNMK